MIVESYKKCPFRRGQKCHARDDRVCKCEPETGRKFPRRCPLRRHSIIVYKPRPVVPSP